ncbi:hypothetical protein FHG87_003614 [Trinorchestia longiramus]|nr:hypothetical protein FHG87_003614 [Trinorchestia longiramus]
MEGFSLWLQTKKLSPEVSCDWTLPLNFYPQQDWEVTCQHPPDLIMVGEFSELKGPLPLLTIPSLNPSCEFQHYKLEPTHCSCACHQSSNQCGGNNARHKSTHIQNQQSDVLQASNNVIPDVHDIDLSKGCRSKISVKYQDHVKKCAPSCPNSAFFSTNDHEVRAHCQCNQNSSKDYSNMECKSKRDVHTCSASTTLTCNCAHIPEDEVHYSEKKCRNVTDEDCNFAHSFSLEDDPFYYGLDLNDLVLKLMSTDYQNFGGVFNLPSDSEVIELDLQHQFSGVSAVVRYVTLFDIYARGFVRPHCIAYLTWDRDKIKTSLDRIRTRMKKASEYLKSTNLCWFAWENKKRLADLQYTKERFLTALKNTRQMSQDQTTDDITDCAPSAPRKEKFHNATASETKFCDTSIFTGQNLENLGSDLPAFRETCSQNMGANYPPSAGYDEDKSLQRMGCRETKSPLLAVDPDVLRTSTSPQELKNCALLHDLPDVCSGIEMHQNVISSASVNSNSGTKHDSARKEVSSDEETWGVSTGFVMNLASSENSFNTANFSSFEVCNKPYSNQTTKGNYTSNVDFSNSENCICENEQTSQKRSSANIYCRNKNCANSMDSRISDEPNSDDLLLSYCSLDTIASQLLDARRTIFVIRKHLETSPEFSEVKELVKVVSSKLDSPLHKVTSQYGMLEPSYYLPPPATEEEEELVSDSSRTSQVEFDQVSKSDSENSNFNDAKVGVNTKTTRKPVMNPSAEQHFADQKVNLTGAHVRACVNSKENDCKDVNTPGFSSLQGNANYQMKFSKGDLTSRTCVGCCTRSSSEVSAKFHRCELPKLYLGSSGRRRYESLRSLRTLSGCGFVSALLELSELHTELKKSSLALRFEAIDADCYFNDPGSLFIGNLPVVKVVDCLNSSWSNGSRESAAITNSIFNAKRNSSTLSARVESSSKSKIDQKSGDSTGFKLRKGKPKYKGSVCYDESIVDQVLNIHVDKVSKDKPTMMQDYGERILVDGERLPERNISPSTIPRSVDNPNTAPELSVGNDGHAGKISDTYVTNSPPNVSADALCLLMSASTLSSTSGGSCTVSSSYDTDHKPDTYPVEMAVAAEETTIASGHETSSPKSGLDEPCSQITQQVLQEARSSEVNSGVTRASASDNKPLKCKPLWIGSFERQSSRSSSACCECCTCQYGSQKCVSCSREESTHISSSVTTKRKMKKKYRNHPRVDIDRRMTTAYYYGLSDLLLNIPGKSKNKLALSDVSQSLIVSLLSGRRLIVAGRTANQRAVKEAITALAAVLLPVAQDNLHPVTAFHRGIVTPHHLHQQPLMGLCIPERLLLHDLIDPCTMSKITTVNLSSGHVSGVAYYGSFIRGIADFIRSFCPREADPIQAVRQWSKSIPMLVDGRAQAYISDPWQRFDIVGSAGELVRSNSGSGGNVLHKFSNANSSCTSRERSSPPNDLRPAEIARNVQSGVGVDTSRVTKTVSRSLSTPDFVNDLFCVNPTGRGGASLLNIAYNAANASSTFSADASFAQHISAAPSAAGVGESATLMSRNSVSTPSNINTYVRTTFVPPYDVLRASVCSSYRDFPSDSRASSSAWNAEFFGDVPTVRESFSDSSPVPLYGNRDAPLQALLQSILVKLGVQVFLYFHVSGNSMLSPSRLMHVLEVRERNDMQMLEYLTSIVARQLDLAGVEVEYLP